MSGFHIPEAQVLTAEDFAIKSREVQERAQANSAAKRILAEAKAEAAAIVEAAEKRAAQADAHLRQVSDEALHRFLNEDALDLTARALGNLLEQARQIRADLDQAQTWVGPLMRTALKRIIGRLPEEDVLAGAVAQSLSEVRDRWDLVVRCHPAMQHQLAGVVENDPRLTSTIREVQVDRNLGIEECRLVSAQGIFDIGVNTQIDTFVRAVERYLTEDTFEDPNNA